MTVHDYYLMLLKAARKAHSWRIREARRWRYFLRDALMDEARSDRCAARRYIQHIREARHAN